jgi:GNAT superfamily N-acetyltransferase
MDSHFSGMVSRPARSTAREYVGERTGIIVRVIVELLPPHTGRALEAMRHLHPALASRDEFVQQVDGRQRAAGYRLVTSVPDDAAPAVAGFRIGDNLAWGRHLYIDDLSTLPAARQQGHARNLLAWLHQRAERLGCRQMHLDSGVGSDRVSAHRLYFNTGYRISSHHFSRGVLTETGGLKPRTLRQMRVLDHGVHGRPA